MVPERVVRFRARTVLTVLGIVLAVAAMRDRTLSRPIFIHAGFNLFATTLTLMHR